ncbi:14446_t:CDS:2 [Cetraspora pellucida]|uniref:14446_t:CDS:1 n=1 Tax=Cetraspora pellucida TaxID=1433469 RepID=A0ACA9KJC0_9GLOM|nr:14446_t:CDS:2 [Cetraspora pellucida]
MSHYALEIVNEVEQKKVLEIWKVIDIRKESETETETEESQNINEVNLENIKNPNKVSTRG